MKLDKGTEIQSILEAAGFNVSIDWNSRFERNGNGRIVVTCNLCNHSCDRSISDLRRAKFFCDGCYKTSLIKTINDKNFTPLDLNCVQYKIQCNTCGTCRTIGQSALYHKENKIDCEGCRNSSYENACEVSGMVYKFSEKYRNGRLVHFCCKKCGNSMQRCATQVMCNEITCSQCRINNYIDILSKKSCSFIKYCNQKVYYITPSGETRSCHISSLHDLSFRVNDYPVNKRKHFIYLIEVCFNGNLYYKIGVAHNIEARLKALKLTGVVSTKSLKEFDCREDAVLYEKSIHRSISQYLIGGNIVSCFSNALRKNRKTGEIKINGYTEWFSHLCLQHISVK